LKFAMRFGEIHGIIGLLDQITIILAIVTIDGSADTRSYLQTTGCLVYKS